MSADRDRPPESYGDAPTLDQLVAPLFAFAAAVRASPDPGSVESLRRTFERLRAEFEAAARRAGIDPALVEHALYALVALIDETMGRTHPDLLEEWQANPLQLQIFDDNSAGVHFYDRLHVLRSSTQTRRRELLEVYLTCLALGFRGMHIGSEGLEALQKLRTELSAEILAADGVRPDTLSPHAVRPPTLTERVLHIPLWTVVVACALVAGLGWTVARHQARSAIEQTVKAIEALGGER
jgi:type IV/VI secretion system ImpK/VasF family protein